MQHSNHFFAACIKHFWMLVLDALNIRQCWTFGVNIRQYWTFGVLNLRMLLRICAFPRLQAQKSANALTDLCFFTIASTKIWQCSYVFFFFGIESTKICECSDGFVRFHECKHEILRMLLRICALCMYPVMPYTCVCLCNRTEGIFTIASEQKAQHQEKNKHRNCKNDG